MNFHPWNIEAIAFVAGLATIAIICIILGIGWVWTRICEAATDSEWEDNSNW